MEISLWKEICCRTADPRFLHVTIFSLWTSSLVLQHRFIPFVLQLLVSPSSMDKRLHSIQVSLEADRILGFSDSIMSNNVMVS